MILGTYRPVEMLAETNPLRVMKEELELHNQCIELRLPLLAQPEVASYVGQRLTDRADSIARAVYARSEGNPLFMVNVVNYLLEQGSTIDVGKIEAPRNIRQMIERNLQRLSADEQRVLEAASVAGVEFSTAAVAAALERPIAEIEACCAPLARREQFVAMEGITSCPYGAASANLRFLHVLYREALYNRLPPVHRNEFHRRIAQPLEAAYGDRVSEIAPALANHYAHTNTPEKAIFYFTITAQQALQRSASASAVQSSSEGLKILRSAPPTPELGAQELALQTILGVGLMATQGWSAPEVEQTFVRAEELCGFIGETPELLRVLYGIWGFNVVRGQLRKAIELGQRIFRIAQKTEDPIWRVVANYALATAFFWTGELGKSAQHFDDLSRQYSISQPRSLTIQFGIDLEIVGLGYSSWQLWVAGFPDRAVAAAERAVRMAKEGVLRETLAWALLNKVAVLQGRGEGRTSAFDR